MNPLDIEACASALRAGELVILPTETVYGLGADAADPVAVARVFEAKGRPRFNPLIAHVSDAAHGAQIARFDERAEALADQFWPGPLTLVLPVRDENAVCDLARAGLSSVAVRCPGHVAARAVIAAFGRAVVAPSANRSGRPSPTTYDDAMEETGRHAGASLDGGPCAVGLESTVVSLLDDNVRVLRPGSITRAEIAGVVGEPSGGEGDAHRSPGRMSLHYAPDAPVKINVDDKPEGGVMIGFGPDMAEADFNLSESADLREAAANLFRLLREADRRKPRVIAVARVPDEGLGEAINDRLRRAAGFIG